MAMDLGSCFRQLKICLDSQQLPQARHQIGRITQLIVEKAEESKAETEFNLECAFAAENGLVAFLQASFAKAKFFAKVNEDIFELFRKTIEKYSPLLRKWMKPIVPIMLRYMQSSSVTARERELAALVLQDCFAYGCLRKDTYEQLDQLLEELLQVFQQRKLPSRFQQNLYELLGQLAKQFPECINDASRLRDVFLNATESQLLEENYPSLVSLAGAVCGMDAFLVHFAPGEDELELRKRLYLLVKKLSIWDGGRSERSVFRNALQLLANHAPLFTVHLYEDHVHWQTMLSGKWIKSSNRDDQRVALAALYAFHGEVARVLSTPELTAGSQRECQPAADVLNRYLAYYRKLLNAPSADRWEIRIAIRGFGIMAEPCKRLVDANASLNELLSIILERIEGICGRSATASSTTSDMLEYLPDFMQALSEILTHTIELSTVQLVSMQTMTVALVRDFYHLSTVHHAVIVRSLLCTLENIGKLGGSDRDQLLDNILLQGIVWSCSHTLPFGSSVATAPTTDNSPRKVDWQRELVTYRNYLPLWQGLLGGAEHANKPLTSVIYRAFMQTLFVIMEKLDLSTRKRTFQDEDGQERELFFCDPNIDLEATKPKDYHIFLNLVELYRDVLHGSQTPLAIRQLFIDWIRPYFERFVRQSLHHPLVSGFVKLIEMGLGTAETIGYFNQAQTSTDDTDAQQTLLLLTYYLEKTIQRSLHAIGELQLACLRFVLNSPVRLLIDLIEDEDRKQPLMVDVFRTALRVGRGFLPIARAAVNCLQRIVRFHHPPMEAKLRENLLRQVLPMLESFLRTRDFSQPAAQTIRTAKFKRHRTANVPSGKIERIKQQHAIEQAMDVSELIKLQMRILNFLGDLQPNECCWLLTGDQDTPKDGRPEKRDWSSVTRWDADSGRSIELRLLCENGSRPCIKLDRLVGRVCQLTDECSDRATKLAACELLHTTVLYLLGIHYQDQLSGLWSQLCPKLLQLSCDPDLAVCQMFEPLLFQIIHFVTQPSKLAQKGTSALLDCLMDATANVQQSATRDLAVRCLREFLQWTNRQSGGSHSRNDRYKIKCTLLEQLKTHAVESDALCRYGSALAFNNLFRLLVQEDYHVLRYSFELMYSYAVGFSVTEEQHGLQQERSDGNEDTVLKQFQLAVDNIGVFLVRRKALFNGEDTGSLRSESRQIIPPEIGGGQMEHLVRWLFRQCAARQRLYRRECMRLFPLLAGAVQGTTDGKGFIAKYFTTEQVKAICLQAGNVQGLDQAPELSNLRVQLAGSSIKNIYSWVEYFLATVDMYCWLCTEQLVPDDASHALLSHILTAVRCFLKTVIGSSIYDLISRITTNVPPEASSMSLEQRMNAEKIVRFDTLKSAAVEQIIDLFVLISARPESTLENITHELWQDESTIEFLLALLFQPQPLGLDSMIATQNEAEDDRRISVQLNTLLLQLIERPSGQRFGAALSDKIISVLEDFGDRMERLLMRRTINTVDQKNARGLLFIAKHYQNRTGDNMTLLIPAAHERFQQVARKLLNDCFRTIGQDGARLVLSPSAARFGTTVLQTIFSLADDIVPSDTNSDFIHETILCCLNADLLVPNIAHGEHFRVSFGSALYEQFFAKPVKCIGIVTEELTTQNFSIIIRMLCTLMEYIYRVHSTDTERLRNLSETLLTVWKKLFRCSREQQNHFGATDFQMIELMANMAMICPFPLSEIRLKTNENYQRWLTGLIGGGTEISIGMKSKAIVLLPTVLGHERTSDEAFDDALERLQTLHFPLRSTEFPPNSPERIGFLNFLERLLDSLVVSRSPLLLKAIVQMTAPDGEGHIAETQIRTAIEKFFENQTMELQGARLQELWNLFANYSYAPAVRDTILRRYICTGLWSCRHDTIIDFYRRNIRSISNFMTVEINGRIGWDLEHALVDRGSSFRLVEHYAALLPKQTLLAESCPIAQELYGSGLDSNVPVRGQRMVADFSKRAHNVRRVPFRTVERTAMELFRKYQCAAYRALVALISNTNDDARMYSVLLFRESCEKGEYLWRNLIDCSDDDLYLEAGQELEHTPRTVQKRIAIRQENTTETSPTMANTMSPGQSVVIESSLSQQVSRFDLNHSVILSAQDIARKDAAELAKRQKGARSNVSLERTRINDHEVMATVCGCVRHMVAVKISLDATVHFLATSIIDPGQHKNVRLFLAKLVDNCRKALEPHAAILLTPLMQLIVDERIFCGLNTLVTDLIALVLEWSGLARQSSRQVAMDEHASLASVLLRFLMKHACQQHGGYSGSRQQVLRLNLELIKQLVMEWHDVLIVPAELLFEMVTPRPGAHMEERVQFELVAGLQLGTIILINGRDKLVPWMDSTRHEYFRAIVRCLDAPNSSVYKPAAQLVGLCLSRLYPDGPPPEESSQEQQTNEADPYTECIAKLTQIQRAQGRKCIEILYETAKGFPSIADPFLSVISFRVPGAAGSEKAMCLELLLGGCIEKFGDDLYRELASMDLALLLRDSDLLLPTLHLLNRALPLVKELQQLQQLIRPVGLITENQTARVECRAIAYEIMIYIHEKRSTELSDESRQAVWRYLLRGLCDSEQNDTTLAPSVRARILEYLTDSGKLPGDMVERFLYLLSELYDPSIESEFLGCAVALLLDPAIRCRESKDRLFLHEYVNADVKFREYTIDTCARQRHAHTILTPMFTNTFAQQPLQSFTKGSQMEQLIKATQFSQADSDSHTLFEPTQDPSGLTRVRDTFVMPTQHSLLFEANSLQLDRRSQRTGVPSADAITGTQERTFDRLRKRILKDSEVGRQQQTAWAVKRHYSNQRQRTEQRRENASKVTLFRRYRLADYPDLQINLLAFLLPLQALCRRDKACARETFVAIFNGLVDCLSPEESFERRTLWDGFVDRLDQSLHRILESTKVCDPNLFGGLVELTLGKPSGRLTLCPRTVGTVAGASNMPTMGILYLESKLSDGSEFDGEPPHSIGGVHMSRKCSPTLVVLLLAESAETYGQILRRRIARLRYDRVRQTEASSSISTTLIGAFRRLTQLTVHTTLNEDVPSVSKVRQSAWTELFHYSETMRQMAKDGIRPENVSAVVEIMQTALGTDEAPDVDVEQNDLNGKLRQFSLHCLRRSIDVVPVCRTDSEDSEAMDLADPHLRLARYCYDELEPKRTESEELPMERLLVTSLLSGMRYGSREARHLFPVLLQLRNLQNSTLRKEFDELSRIVPSWNFLPWISQLLSYMKIANEDAHDGHFLDELLMRLVREYPMALYFPARLLTGEDSVRPFVVRFRDALCFPMLDRFVEELCRVAMPITHLFSMVDDLRSYLNTCPDLQPYHAFLERNVPNAFRTNVNQTGRVYQKVIPLVNKWRNLQHLHPVEDRDMIMQSLNELERSLKKMRLRTKTAHVALEELSPWLADYHCSGHGLREDQSAIELPGQYGVSDGGPPRVSQHITIVRILPDLVVYGTLRQPVQITFQCSDGRNHRFLAKSGEDLRQDQRIQQLQREITHRLRWDRRCREQRLELRTYEVVPIRQNFGLLEWLEGTIALQTIALEAGPRYNRRVYCGQTELNEQYIDFLLNMTSRRISDANDPIDRSNLPALHGLAAAQEQPERLQSKFVELSQHIRGDTLKRALFDMATTPESFYRLRMNFAKSLATMNVTCWALGIGDRHLGNIMLERATGKLIGVDFGIAFGAGTFKLLVPELVPFRLTPQFVGVMDPLRVPGALQNFHLYTLQCLRDSRNLLRACLEVFVRDPTVDWLRMVRERGGGSDQTNSSNGACGWNPESRVNTVLRKLNGGNPKRILADELRISTIAMRPEYLHGYLSILTAAAPETTLKAEGSTENLSTELQNEMLLEMATDGRLLGIAYGGWYPWF